MHLYSYGYFRPKLIQHSLLFQSLDVGHSHGEGGEHHHGGVGELLAKNSHIWKIVAGLSGVYLFYLFEIFMRMADGTGHGHSHSHGVAVEVRISSAL